MESTIATQCFVEQETGLVLDMAGNKLPAGSVISCKLTVFVIMEHGDIDYVGGGKMEMVYWADDEYFEFLHQQVKETHMERSQGLITSMFRALRGNRSKTRKRQVTWIPPATMTVGSQTPATLSDAPTSESLAENVTQDEHVTRQLATLEEEPLEESSPNNELGESYVAGVNEMVNMFPYFVLMQRSMSTSQITLTNN